MRSVYLFAQMALIMGSLSVATEVNAQKAPATLRGKSLSVTWTENRLQRREGGGEFRPRSVPNRLQVYISSEGRTFERRSIGSAFNEGVSGGAITGTAWGSHRAGGSRFQGNSLILAGATRSGGARVVTITFAPDFSTCSVRVQVGHEVGSNVIRGNSLRNGASIEFTMQGITGENCSIQSGNVFAQ